MELKPLNLEEWRQREFVPESVFNDIKNRIKSACEFYLRYRNNPELFEKEMNVSIIEKLRKEWHNWEEHFDRYVFRLAFKSIYSGERSEE